MDICQPIACADLTLGGELGHRLELSFQRLEGYDAELTLCGNDGWPADREGRAILGQVLTGRAVHRVPRHTDALIAALPAGMMGPPLDPTAIREQQVTGNQWLLRAYCEHYLTSGRADLLARIDALIAECYLPLIGHVATYPIDPARRVVDPGAVAGHEAERVVDGWVVSTDIGAVFITLDGLTQAWEIRPRDDLRRLIDETIARFAQLDAVALGLQTHATLSCLRGLLRWHRLQNRPDLLAMVQRIFAIYLARASTEQHHNWNWFGRPTWTEPCAVVDSFEVALGLWRATGDTALLATAQEILFSGLARQLSNGGYTIDCCTGAAGEVCAGPKGGVKEVVWCCTMRGAEGFARAAEHCWCPGPGRVYLPWQSDSVATLRTNDGEWRLRQESDYPNGGTSHVVVAQAPSHGVIEIAFYAAPWVDRARATGVEAWDGDWALVRLPATVGAARTVALPFTLRRQPAHGEMAASHSSFRHGPVLLALRHPTARVATSAELGAPVRVEGLGYRTAGGGLLEAIGAATWVPGDGWALTPRQVLFAR